jgi:hypothetical protein
MGEGEGKRTFFFLDKQQPSHARNEKAQKFRCVGEMGRGTGDVGTLKSGQSEERSNTICSDFFVVPVTQTAEAAAKKLRVFLLEGNPAALIGELRSRVAQLLGESSAAASSPPKRLRMSMSACIWISLPSLCTKVVCCWLLLCVTVSKIRTGSRKRKVTSISRCCRDPVPPCWCSSPPTHHCEFSSIHRCCASLHYSSTKMCRGNPPPMPSPTGRLVPAGSFFSVVSRIRFGPMKRPGTPTFSPTPVLPRPRSSADVTVEAENWSLRVPDLLPFGSVGNF